MCDDTVSTVGLRSGVSAKAGRDLSDFLTAASYKNRKQIPSNGLDLLLMFTFAFERWQQVFGEICSKQGVLISCEADDVVPKLFRQLLSSGSEPFHHRSHYVCE